MKKVLIIGSNSFAGSDFIDFFLDKKLKAVHMASSGYFLKTTPVRMNQDIVKITIR